MLLLDVTCGLIVVETPATNAALLPFAFWMFIVVLISWVASTVLLLFGAYTGMKLKYDEEGPKPPRTALMALLSSCSVMDRSLIISVFMVNLLEGVIAQCFGWVRATCLLECH